MTGSSSSIGSALLEKISFELYDVTCISRRKHNYNSKSINIYVGNLEEKKTLHEFPKQDVVVHIAGVTHAKKYSEYYNGNVKTTINLIDYCQKLGIKHFIYISSRTALPNSGIYGETKLLAEKVIVNSKIPYTIFRLSEVYGKDANSLQLLNFSIKDWPFILIPGYDDYKLCPVHIDDVIQVMLAGISLKNASNKVYLIAGDQEYSFQDLATLMSEYLRINKRIIYIPILLIRILSYFNLILEKPLLFPDQINRLICEKPTNIDLAKNDFNFEPKPIHGQIEKICK